MRETLPITERDLPKKLDGISEIQYLVIDDGSKDDTVNVARKLNVNHFIRHNKNNGLAKTFKTVIENCIKLGADIADV